MPMPKGLDDGLGQGRAGQGIKRAPRPYERVYFSILLLVRYRLSILCFTHSLTPSLPPSLRHHETPYGSRGRRDRGADDDRDVEPPPSLRRFMLLSFSFSFLFFSSLLFIPSDSSLS